MKRLILLLVLATVSCVTYAQQGPSCDSSAYQTVDRFIHAKGLIKDGTLKHNALSSDCHVYKGNPKLAVVVFGYTMTSSSSNDGTDGVFIGIIDRAERKVVSYNWRKIYEDALNGLGRYSLRITNDNIELNNNANAIELEYDSSESGSRCADAGWGGLSTIFVQNGTTLVPVFQTYKHFYKYTKGCFAASSSDSESMQSDLTLNVSNRYTNGYKDLVITDTDSGHKLTLKYSGSKYVWPKETPWWTDLEIDNDNWTLP